MTPEQQRIAIAEACGWTDISEPYSNEFEWTGIFRSLFRDPIPDYLNDLNAMHEAEKVLNATLLNSYRRLLYLVVLDDQVNTSNEPAWATAAQRAEAFLRTTGKWVES